MTTGKKKATDLTTKSAAFSRHSSTLILTTAEKLSNSFFGARNEAGQMLGCCKETISAIARASLLQKEEHGLFLVTNVVQILRRGRPFMGRWKC